MPSMPIPVGAKYLSLPQIANTGGTAQITDIRSGNYMSPLQPLRQMTPEGTKPRTFGVVPGYNLIWQPKGDETYGFWIIREFAESCDLFRLILDTLEDRLCSAKWEIRLLPEPGEPQKHLQQRQAQDPRVKAMTQLFRKPDGVLPFSKWLRQWFEDSMVIDAAAIYKERDWKGRIASLRVLDGASINRRITEQAFTPPPPSVAYQQILYGTIWANFTTDDLTYVMRSPRSWKIYGFGQVEKCLTHIGIALRRQQFLSDYYTSGNMPEAMCFLPADLPLDRVKEFQDWFDTILAGDLSNRRRLRFLPGFGKMGEKVSPNVIFPKEVLLKDPLDEWLFQMFCYDLGMPPNAMLRIVNRATAQQNVESSEEEGLEPRKQDIKEVLDDIIQSDGGFDYDDMEFIWSTPREMDQLKQAQTDEIYVNTGVKSRNEIRENLGDDPDPSPEADKLTVTTAQGIVPIDAADQLDQMQARQDISSQNEPDDNDTPPGKKKPKVGKLSAAQVLSPRLLKEAKTASIDPNHSSHAITKAQERIESACKKVFRRQKDIVETELKKLVKSDRFGLLTIRRIRKRSDVSRKIIKPQIGDDGLFVDTGEYDEVIEMHLRDTFSKMFQYADPWAGDSRTFDPTGNNLCGACNKYEPNSCVAVEGEISDVRGSCRHWEDQDAGDSELLFAEKISKNMADYGETPKNGFGCKRCEYHTAAKSPDSHGRDMFCKQGAFRVFKNGCCALNDCDGMKSWNPDGTTSISGPEVKADGGTLQVQRMVSAAFALALRKDDENEKTPKEISDSVFDAIKKEFEAMTPDVAAALREAAIDGINRGLVQIEVTDSDMISEVNTIAANWASKRAAELVGMKYDEDGNLIENPRAKYAITDTTRDELRRIIKQAFEKETQKDELIAAVQDAGAFSDARATMIARTEVVRAQTQGNFEIWKQSGLVKSVRWQISDDNPCPICILNDDQVRKIGEEFPSGDVMPQVHPNCACVLIAVEFNE